MSLEPATSNTLDSITFTGATRDEFDRAVETLAELNPDDEHVYCALLEYASVLRADRPREIHAALDAIELVRDHGDLTHPEQHQALGRVEQDLTRRLERLRAASP